MAWAMHGRSLRSALVLALLALTGLLVAQPSAAATPAVPIESTGPVPTLPQYAGSSAVARPATGVPFAWPDPATNTTGGAYFYLDAHDRVVVAASNHHILVVTVAGSRAAPHFRQVADYDPTSCLSPGDRIPSVLPDAEGRLWFVGRYRGA